MGEHTKIFEKKLFTWKCYLFEWFFNFICFDTDDYRSRFWSALIDHLISKSFCEFSPQKAQNLILCFTLNLKSSKNMMRHITKTCKKFWEESEIYFTIIPTSDIFILNRKKPGGDLKGTILIIAAYLMSSITDRLKILFAKIR